MEYWVEVWDPWGRRIAAFDEIPLLEAEVNAPDEADRISGLLPAACPELGPGYTVRVYIDGTQVCDAEVVETRPEWSDRRKLILERYVHFHETLAFEAVGSKARWNPAVVLESPLMRADALAKRLIQEAAGTVHYTVDHTAYPDGAAREMAKFLERALLDRALEVGGVVAGHWAGGARVDASGAYAKDGKTVAGLVVDGAAWPDVRLMMVDAEELTLNDAAKVRHPETADWTAARYAASGYAVRAQKTKDALDALLAAKGVDYVELNPHVDGSGAFDGRLDGEGRYAALVFGTGECLNAALIEQGFAGADLESLPLDPNLELKDFASYGGPSEDSIALGDAGFSWTQFDGPLHDVLTALAYGSGGYAWGLSPEGTVWMRPVETVDRVVFYDPVVVGVVLGAQSAGVVNVLGVRTNPDRSSVRVEDRREPSVLAFEEERCELDAFWLDARSDAERFARTLLDEAAYPATAGEVYWFHGAPDMRVGELVELRGAPIERLSLELEGEWGGRFAGKHVARVRRVTHRIAGQRLETTAVWTSPMRSVGDPVEAVRRAQAAEAAYRLLGLDGAASLDEAFELA